jgi:hypothetical protein
VADFFVRFHHIIKKEAPHIKTVLCAGGVEDKELGEIEYEEEFMEAVRACDIWSVDKYLALNFGWPYKVAERGGDSHLRYSPAEVYDFAKRSFKRFVELNGGAVKPMVLSELNADADVTGAFEQAEMVKEYIGLIKDDVERWLCGFAFYQFRDRGRLGLETEDPNNAGVGIEQPVMGVYKEIIHDPFFSPVIETAGETKLPITLRWGGSEDATGIAVELDFEKTPVFCDAVFKPEDTYNLIMELNGKWFYKSPKARTIDLMPAFYEHPLTAPAVLNLNIFAPPASGENDISHGKDWQINYYTRIDALPAIRLRFEPVMDKI